MSLLDLKKELIKQRLKDKTCPICNGELVIKDDPTDSTDKWSAVMCEYWEPFKRSKKYPEGCKFMFKVNSKDNAICISIDGFYYSAPFELNDLKKMYTSVAII
jgi:hypothetical protein